MDEDRIKHSLAVARKMVEIAKNYQILKLRIAFLLDMIID